MHSVTLIGMDLSYLNTFMSSLSVLWKEYVTVQDAPEAKALLTKQADWARVTNQLQEAAQMYIAAGDFLTSIEIVAQNNWTDMYDPFFGIRCHVWISLEF